jgi:hypothetical protein
MTGKYENENPLQKLHEGEPYFFLRSQDIHAPEAVRAYAEFLCDSGDIYGGNECYKFANRMERWQDENRDKVKNPD